MSNELTERDALALELCRAERPNTPDACGLHLEVARQVIESRWYAARRESATEITKLADRLEQEDADYRAAHDRPMRLDVSLIVAALRGDA